MDSHTQSPGRRAPSEWSVANPPEEEPPDLLIIHPTHQLTSVENTWSPSAPTSPPASWSYALSYRPRSTAATSTRYIFSAAAKFLPLAGEHVGGGWRLQGLGNGRGRHAAQRRFRKSCVYSCPLSRTGHVQEPTSTTPRRMSSSAPLRGYASTRGSRVRHHSA